MTYRVVVTREGDHWLADVPDLEGTHTYASSLRKLDEYVREVVVMAADLPDEAMAGLKLAYEYDLGDARLNDHVARIQRDRTCIDAARKRLEDDRTAVIAASRSASLSQRDVAAMVGLSHQRVSQMEESLNA